MTTLARFIFNYIGGVIRWIFGSIYRRISNKRTYEFNEYINGPKDSNHFYDTAGHTFVNMMIGLFAIVTLGILATKCN